MWPCLVNKGEGEILLERKELYKLAGYREYNKRNTYLEEKILYLNKVIIYMYFMLYEIF